MGFVYYWLVTDMPVDRDNRCTLEVEEKLKKGLKEILEKYDVKINRDEYIEWCISLLKERANLVMCDIKTGEIVKRFDSKTSAAKYIYNSGISNSKSNYDNAIRSITGHITTAIKKQGNAYGYRWKLAKETGEEIFSELQLLSK